MTHHSHVAGEKLREALVQHNEVRALDLPMIHICFPPFAVATVGEVGASGAKGKGGAAGPSVKEK